jgi:hypothetical protein
VASEEILGAGDPERGFDVAYELPRRYDRRGLGYGKKRKTGLGGRGSTTGVGVRGIILIGSGVVSLEGKPQLAR